LVKAAERSARPEEEEEEGAKDEEIEDEEIGDKEMQDDVNEAVQEIETEELNTTANAICELQALLTTQKACLEFCIALLSQLITRKEYDSLLVCALAVLGVKEDG
jgi:hypothetical protein